MGKSAIKKPKSNGSASPSTKRSTSSEADTKETPTKGKRKVTFDVKPDVAIINSNGPVHKIDESKPEQGQ
ncbi:hypothetical protein EUX98_g2885 [Antrodiella citrinella]|uniref:Uncharacterized protein n=1 Tax=Antrodiella citrinella TaxID=2447956 RepID=A0A4S4N031_9APHY|nr:hypothetical protein EUX98_g2885 [Antrodiella citrinella]